jgi:hypothetical protein
MITSKIVIHVIGTVIVIIFIILIIIFIRKIFSGYSEE